MIPIQLKEFNFCRVKKNTKKPFEKDWTNKFYSYDEINNYYPQENYGIHTGINQLGVLDDDSTNKILLKLALEKFGNTFRVRDHLYFKLKDWNGKKIIFFDDSGKHLGELQGLGQMVVGAGSIHPSGEIYELKNDIPIIEIDIEKFKEVFKDFIPNFNSTNHVPTINSNWDGKDIKDIPITNVISLSGLNEVGNGCYQGTNPFHGSTTGMNFRIDTRKNTWFCFRCSSGGSSPELIAVKEGIINCSDAGKHCLQGDKGSFVIKIAREKYGLKSPEKTKEIEKKELINPNEEEQEKMKILLGKTYEGIIEFIKNYVDLNKQYYPLLALWIIGTYCHKSFNAYPYLFINAMRGSGKTRLLKIIKELSWNGELLTSVREATLFRSAGNNTICIDEFEGIMNKENEGLREILNSSYKKGMTIKRMKKKRTLDGEGYVIEIFEPYTPIAMANIWGVEEVLGDRCIIMILEKSKKTYLTKKVEDFDNNFYINIIKNNLNLINKYNLVQLCSYFGVDSIYKRWNLYVDLRNNTLPTYNTLNTLTTYNTSNTNKTQENPCELNVIENIKLDTFFRKIDEIGIDGRNLELFMPLFVIGNVISEDLLIKILEIAKTMNKEKKKEEMTESRDVMLFNFVSTQQEDGNFVSLNDLLNGFRNYVHDDEKEYQWLNSRWLGRALKRLSLTIEKRRMYDGMQVILNIKKAKEKVELFKEDDR